MPHPKILRWIIIPDPHIPVHDTKSFAAIEALMKDYRFDGWLCVGDLMDFNQISSHNLNNLRAVEGERLQYDYQIAREFLDRHRAILKRRNLACKMVLLEGNHDYRVERHIDAHPELQGLLEVETALDLKGRGITWVPYWSKGTVYEIGRATFIHGRYCNDHHAKKHVMAYGRDVFYGHTHDVQAYSLARYGETPIGQSLGHLCLPQPYMRGAPDRWQQAFAIFEFQADGEFDYHLIRINNHGFTYGGKGYRG